MAEAEQVKYEVGDMVWAKLKFYSWWPGQIYNEAWASPSVFQTKKEGYVLVAFFGDNTYSWVDPKKLIPFDRHYVEKSKQTKTSAFLNAFEEAENEISRRAALGLACQCYNLLNFRPINLFDWFYTVDIKGYETSGIYSMKQIRSARDWFQPVVTLSFLRKLALMSGRKFRQDVDWIKNAAMVCAYRNAVFEETDESYAAESGAQSEHLGYSTMDLDQQEKVSAKVPLSGSIEISATVGQREKLASSVELTGQPKRGNCISKLEVIKIAVTQDDSKHPGEYLSSENVIKVDNKKRKKEAELQCNMTHVFKNHEAGRNESLESILTEKSSQTSLLDKENSLTSQKERKHRLPYAVL